MIEKQTLFHGQPMRLWQTEHLQVGVLTQAGPRIVWLSLAGSEQNILAEVPHKTTVTSGGTFRFWGGHRLWHAPEMLARTYEPDDQLVDISVDLLANQIAIQQKPEPNNHMQKQIVLTLAQDEASMTVRHELTNCGAWPASLAAWGITMLQVGGTAVLPQSSTQPQDPDGVQPNRHLVLWPYTRWDDPRLQFGAEQIEVGTQLLPYASKIGTFSDLGLLHYVVDGVRFSKQFQPQPEKPHVDRHTNVQIYVCDEFIELETLSPLTALAPQETIIHDEVWRLESLLPSS